MLSKNELTRKLKAMERFEAKLRELRHDDLIGDITHDYIHLLSIACDDHTGMIKWYVEHNYGRHGTMLFRKGDIEIICKSPSKVMDAINVMNKEV